MTSHRVVLAAFATLALGACRTKGVPEPPPERDPTRADAEVLQYEPPADLLGGEVFRAGEKPPEKPARHHHGGGHAGHGEAGVP